jgi:hypothetical protein
VINALLRRATPIAAVLAVLAATSLLARAQSLGPPERYTATAVNLDRGGSSTVQIVVTRWSTDAERDRLATTLLDKGADKLLDVLQDTPKVGYVRSPTGLGWDLHYARRTPLPDGGERVVLATDRPLNFAETVNQPRTVDYPFTIIELRLNAEGEGEGKMSVATKIIADKESGTIVLENYGTQPVMLQAVKREKTT